MPEFKVGDRVTTEFGKKEALCRIEHIEHGLYDVKLLGKGYTLTKDVGELSTTNHDERQPTVLNPMGKPPTYSSAVVRGEMQRSFTDEDLSGDILIFFPHGRFKRGHWNFSKKHWDCDYMDDCMDHVEGIRAIGWQYPPKYRLPS